MAEIDRPKMKDYGPDGYRCSVCGSPTCDCEIEWTYWWPFVSSARRGWRLGRRWRVALWIVVTLCLMAGGGAASALAWAWALVLVAAFVLGAALLAGWWLFGRP
jgi:hypothetical protein